MTIADIMFYIKAVLQPYSGWLLVFLSILSYSLLIPGIMMGVYTSIKQIYGTSYEYLFGYSRGENNSIKFTGILNRAILIGGLFSILGGICGLVAVHYGKAENALIFWGVLLGAVIGIGYSFRKPRTWKASGRTIVAGILVGMVIGALTAWLLGQMISGATNRVTAWTTGAIVGGIAGFFGGLASNMTGWFPGGVVGGIAGGIAGNIAFTRIAYLLPTLPDSNYDQGIFFGILGGMSGIIIGYVVGIAISLIAVLLTKTMELIIRITNKIFSAAMVPSLILSRFKTIICNRCLRYTEPLKSGYEDGRRYCEHCEQEVEYTHEPGMVLLTFGVDSLSKSESRVFILSDPDFEHKEHRIDASKVYIDVQNTDKRLLERFITYMINYPPKDGLSSLRVFYQGELDELGENLKNALNNNFEHIAKVPDFSE